MPSHPIPAISFAPRSVRSGCLIDGGTSPVATRCPGNELTLAGCVSGNSKALAPCSRISWQGTYWNAIRSHVASAMRNVSLLLNPVMMSTLNPTL